MMEHTSWQPGQSFQVTRHGLGLLENVFLIILQSSILVCMTRLAYAGTDLGASQI